MLSGETWSYNVEPWDTIEYLKIQIEDKEGIPHNLQAITLLGGKQLENHRTFSECGITHESTVYWLRRLLGC